MDESRRTTFHFGDDVEVRYVSRLPRRGDVVRRTGKLWVVTDVEPDPVGGHEARFDRPRDVARRVRLGAVRMRQLDAAQRERAARLRERAAEVADRAARLRQRSSR